MKQLTIINKDITTITEGIIVHQVNNKGDVVATLINKNLVVCDLVAQDGYGEDRCYTIYEALAKSLMKVNKLATLANKPVYIPYGIGCELAGGDWNIIENIIRKCCPQAIICNYSK